MKVSGPPYSLVGGNHAIEFLEFFHFLDRHAQFLDLAGARLSQLIVVRLSFAVLGRETIVYVHRRLVYFITSRHSDFECVRVLAWSVKNNGSFRGSLVSSSPLPRTPINLGRTSNDSPAGLA